MNLFDDIQNEDFWIDRIEKTYSIIENEIISVDFCSITKAKDIKITFNLSSEVFYSNYYYLINCSRITTWNFKKEKDSILVYSKDFALKGDLSSFNFMKDVDPISFAVRQKIDLNLNKVRQLKEYEYLTLLIQQI